MTRPMEMSGINLRRSERGYILIEYSAVDFTKSDIEKNCRDKFSILDILRGLQIRMPCFLNLSFEICRRLCRKL